ncbi:MAG: SpoIIE family protein phosphatase [Candidatus Ozemobacteraceae bacterium]
MAILFCGFPLLLIDFALRYVLEVQESNSHAEGFARLENRLTRLQPLSDPQLTLRQTLLRLVRRAKRQKEPEAYLVRTAQKIEKKFPGLFSFTILNRLGKVVFLGNMSESKRVAEMFWNALKNFRQGNPGPFFQHTNLFSPFTGTIFKLQPIYDRVNWLTTSPLARKTWFFSRLGEDFSLFVNVHKGGYPPMFALRNISERASGDGVTLLLYDLKTKSFSTENVAALGSQDFIWRIITFFEREPEPRYESEDRLWASLVLDQRFRLIASVPKKNESNSKVIQATFRFVSGLLLLAVLYITWAWVVQGPIPYVSLRLKLILLFLLASALPLAVFTFLGFTYVQERRESLIWTEWRKSADILRAFDSKFPETLRACQERLEKIFSECRMDTYAGLAAFVREITAFQAIFPCRDINLLASDAKIVFSTNKMHGRESTETRIFRSLMVGVLANLNKDAPGKARKMALQTEILLSALPQRDGRQLIEEITGKLGEVLPLDLGVIKSFLFIDSLGRKNGTGFADYIFSAHWQQQDMFKSYLRRTLPFKPLGDGSEMMVLEGKPHFVSLFSHPRLQRLYPNHWRLQVAWYYPNRAINRDIRKFMKNAMRVKQVFHAKVNYKGAETLVTAVPGNHLQDFFLLFFKPLAEIEEELWSLKMKFWFFGLFSLLFAIALGGFLSGRVLQPVRDLSLGIRAVHEKKFKERIPTQDPDELGDLADLFNSMMESLEEVSTARVVQEQLFPQKPLVVGDYAVFGLSRPLSELGGDYFDFLAVDAKRLLVLIGDVSGHGVPAALVMAMCKSLILGLVNQGVPVRSILETWNMVVHQTVKIKKRLFMTMSVLLIDTETHEGILYNCGHPFPVLKAGLGNCQTLSPTGVPIGSWVKLSVTPLPVSLKAGEQLIFYTDGLAESLPGGNNTEKFSDLKRFFGSRPILPVDQAPLDFLENHPFIVQGNAQTDDFTIVVVERRIRVS